MDGDGDHRQLKDDGKGSKAKEAKHGKTEQDCPVDVLKIKLMTVFKTRDSAGKVVFVTFLKKNVEQSRKNAQNH